MTHAEDIKKIKNFLKTKRLLTSIHQGMKTLFAKDIRSYSNFRKYLYDRVTDDFYAWTSGNSDLPANVEYLFNYFSDRGFVFEGIGRTRIVFSSGQTVCKVDYSKRSANDREWASFEGLGDVEKDLVLQPIENCAVNGTKCIFFPKVICSRNWMCTPTEVEEKNKSFYPMDILKKVPSKAVRTRLLKILEGFCDTHTDNIGWITKPKSKGLIPVLIDIE